MFNEELLAKHLRRLGFDDYDFSSVRIDDSGDFVRGFVVDLDFSQVKEKVLNTKYYSIQLEPEGIKSQELSLKMNEMIEGYNVFYRFNIKKEPLGVEFSATLKRIDFYDAAGREYPLMSSTLLRNIQKRIEMGEEILREVSS